MTNTDLPEWGPKMLALPNDRWRNFVMALYDEEAPRKNDGLLLYAIRKAGFGTPTSTTKAMSVPNPIVFATTNGHRGLSRNIPLQ